MYNPEIEQPGAENVVEFGSFDEIPTDPKEEGLRPYGKYAGGDADEIIVVDGVRYRKKPAWTVRGVPALERHYYQHPGPGWDTRNSYLLNGWDIDDMDAEHLSDLPLYNLEIIEEDEE